jgi:hypothetical protein
MSMAAGALATAGGALAVEYGRVWRRGSAPLPSETTDLIGAAEVAAGEIVESAVIGYQEATVRQNAAFNLMWSLAGSVLVTRGITTVLRHRGTAGPFRDLRVGDRHIHHFVPGIAIAFIAGGLGIVSRDDRLQPLLAIPFGAGVGMTLDESALLLELDDVYWTDEGILSVQISMFVLAAVGATIMGVRFLRRGETIVLDEGATG